MISVYSTFRWHRELFRNVEMSSFYAARFFSVQHSGICCCLPCCGSLLTECEPNYGRGTDEQNCSFERADGKYNRQPLQIRMHLEFVHHEVDKGYPHHLTRSLNRIPLFRTGIATVMQPDEELCTACARTRERGGGERVQYAESRFPE